MVTHVMHERNGSMRCPEGNYVLDIPLADIVERSGSSKGGMSYPLLFHDMAVDKAPPDEASNSFIIATRDKYPWTKEERMN